MEALLPVVVQLVAGVIGAYAVAASVPQMAIGQAAKIVSGAIGGVVGGQLLGLIVGDPEGAGMAAAVIRDGLGGVAGGAILTAIVGPVMRSMSKS